MATFQIGQIGDSSDDEYSGASDKRVNHGKRFGLFFRLVKFLGWEEKEKGLAGLGMAITPILGVMANALVRKLLIPF